MTAAANGTRLITEDLGIRIGERWLIRHVSVQVRPGEVVALVGANGSGKTTLLRTLAGFLKPQAGQVLLDGRPLPSYSSRERARRLAVVPQSVLVEAAMSSEDVVLLGRHPHLGRFQVEGKHDHAIARLAMQSTHTEPFADQTASTLSGGERQRVIIARALAQEPMLLLLDEPTASLDLRQQEEVMALVRRLADSGLAVIAAIHDLRLAARYADRLVVLAKGEIIADAPAEQALTPNVLAAAFGVRACVAIDPVTGLPDIVMLPASDVTPHRETVHVIAGGGRGAAAIAALASAGFRLTVGPVGEGDTDLLAARLAGARVLARASFQPIDAAIDAEHRQLIRRADVVVIADVPWGTANLPNLLAAAEAKTVILVDGMPIGDRDFTGGEAAGVLRRIAADGAPIAPLENLVEVVAACAATGVAQ